MTEPPPAPILAFLRGDGADGRGRRLAQIIAQDDAWLEATHDYIQWLFPLREPSRAVSDAPVLSAGEADRIRRDDAARAGLQAALQRMEAFYGHTRHWRCAYDHNHLRITRIITATRDLLGQHSARHFHAALLRQLADSPVQINPHSLGYWRTALGD